MMNMEDTFRDQDTLDVIRTLAANGESGKLQIRTGATDGALFFRNGQLVDARVGSLTGFQAINAAASIRDASFSFDPSVVPPALSSITPNERVVLKQFFGIDTVAREEFQELPVVSDSTVDPDEEEVTLVGSAVPAAEVPTPIPPVPSSNWIYRGGAVLAFVFLVIVVAAVALRNQFREQSSPASSAPVVTSVQPSSSAPPPLVHETAAPRIAEAAPAPAPARDLTGNWNVVNTVQKTSYTSYKDLQIGFDLAIKQNGSGFTGRGEKVSENGRSLPPSGRTPIQVKGSVAGDRVEATFFEEGTARKTNGRFVWRINKAGALTGVFVSTAARTSGKSTARKEL